MAAADTAGRKRMAGAHADIYQKSTPTSSEDFAHGRNGTWYVRTKADGFSERFTKHEDDEMYEKSRGGHVVEALVSDGRTSVYRKYNDAGVLVESVEKRDGPIEPR